MALTEEECRELHIPLGEGWTVENSPLVALHDRKKGGVNVVFLGVPGCGKSRASYLWAHRLYERERLWIRGQLDVTWLLRFREKAIVWVPPSTTFEVTDEAGNTVPVDVRTYTTYADLLSRATVGYAHVLYWPHDDRNRWVNFLEALLNRKDRQPQLVLDDEAQQIAPISASNHGGAYQRMSRFRTILEQARKTRISFLLSSHQSHDMDYQVAELCQYAVLMTASSPPSQLSTTCRRIRRSLPGLPTGAAFVVGMTAKEGARYQRMSFGDTLGPTSDLIVSVKGPPPPEPVRKERKYSVASPEVRESFIATCETGQVSVTEACDRHGIDRGTGYRWLKEAGIAVERTTLATPLSPPS